ncbi:MAG: AI-2E family transporter [Acidobacteriota bacterium]|nr:AI-2E family transporter [Blastocatellia bacterium]MDW8411167.1 AI-2E family transporter [Acidobacteriota bacterium]
MMSSSQSSAVRNVTVLVLLIASGYLLFEIILPFLNPVLWAITVAIFVAPLQRRLDKRIKNKNISAALGLALTFAVVIIPVSFLAVQLVQQIRNLYQEARHSQQVEAIYDWLAGRADLEMLERVGLSSDSMRQTVLENTERIAKFAADAATSILKNTLSVPGSFFFFLFTLFFLLRDGHNFLDWIIYHLPLDSEQKTLLMQRIIGVINATFIGRFVVASAQGLLAGLMFVILGVPGTLLWTVLMVLLAMIPLLGTFLVWVPVAIWLIATGSPVKGIVLIVWGIGVVSSIDNLLWPVIMSSQVRLHTLVAFFAVLGGIKYFGPIGLVMGPIVFACFLTLMDFATEQISSESTKLLSDK